MVKHDTEIDRGEIPGIISEWGELVHEFYRYKAYGNPYSTGWRSWPCHVLDVIDCLSAAEGTKLKMSRGK